MRRLGMDLKASAEERSDYTAVTEWVEDGDHNLYLVGRPTSRFVIPGTNPLERLNRGSSAAPR